MKRTLLTAALAATLFTTGLIATAKQPTVNADVAHTVHMYHFKKVGKHYVVKKKYPEMIFKNLKHTDKAITYHGTKYYYNPLYQGYLASDKYHLSFKKHAHKQATNNDNNTGTNNTNNTNNTNTNQNSDQIVDGFDETTSTVVDQTAYINAFKNYMIQDINNYRQSQGLQPLTLDTGKLEDIAMTRAQQEYEYADQPWYKGHYDKNGQGFARELAVQNELYPDYDTAEQHMAENTEYGRISDSENFEAPKSMAQGEINSTINEGANGGHYKNLTSPYTKTVGIGLYIGTQNGVNTNVGYAEDYSN